MISFREDLCWFLLRDSHNLRLCWLPLMVFGFTVSTSVSASSLCCCPKIRPLDFSVAIDICSQSNPPLNLLTVSRSIFCFAARVRALEIYISSWRPNSALKSILYMGCSCFRVIVLYIMLLETLPKMKLQTLILIDNLTILLTLKISQ